jgi:hypothetical protein
VQVEAFELTPAYVVHEGGYADAGSYEVRDTTAVITGRLGTGYWKRSLQ